MRGFLIGECSNSFGCKFVQGLYFYISGIKFPIEYFVVIVIQSIEEEGEENVIYSIQFGVFIQTYDSQGVGG